MDKQPVSEVFTIRLPLELRDALDHAAAADHRTTASLIRKILTEWLRRIPIQKGPRKMKSLAIALSVAMALHALPAAAQGSPQFNPYSGKWEMALPGSSPQFNPYSGKYEMAAPGASPQFNPYSGQYEFAH